MPGLITTFPRNQQLAWAQPDLQSNFEDISEIWGINHFPFNLPVPPNPPNTPDPRAGMHSEIDFLSQAAVPAGAAGLIRMLNVPDQFGNLFLYFVKQASASQMQLKFYNTPAIKTICVKLPSGIIVKASMFFGTFSGSSSGLYPVTWRQLTNNGQEDIPFTTQLWAQPILGISAGQVSVSPNNPSIAYLENISIPSQVVIRIWRRASFDNPENNLQCFTTLLAIGV